MSWKHFLDIDQSEIGRVLARHLNGDRPQVLDDHREHLQEIIKRLNQAGLPGTMIIVIDEPIPQRDSPWFIDQRLLLHWDDPELQSHPVKFTASTYSDHPTWSLYSRTGGGIPAFGVNNHHSFNNEEHIKRMIDAIRRRTA